MEKMRTIHEVDLLELVKGQEEVNEYHLVEYENM
jgi:hypothetical protein